MALKTWNDIKPLPAKVERDADTNSGFLRVEQSFTLSQPREARRDQAGQHYDVSKEAAAD